MAKATGLNFYKPGQDDDEEEPLENDDDKQALNNSMEDFGVIEDKAIDKETDKVVDFKRYTNFVRFNGRH